ncbi:hypothetical protein DFP72DRAFT_859457 [Ephemerocybe angulata]|uniref:Uncharacterized protein n=1 Tax=Ephemerocybe angulata TaxID=980116 RepID=A0A8H6HBN4_9AGAR|nr:hypothetical protein DFP72DRAFT_859457 [Tulosesus angulatus]
MGQFEELSDLNKYFPIFYEGGEDPEPVGIPIAPGIETPSYSLGWMVRSPGIGKLHVDYTVAREKIILPNWSAHNCIPKDLNVMGNYGLIVPDFMVIGMDYVFIRIADNNPFIIKALRSERDRSHLIIRQAMVVLGLLDDPNNSTDPTGSVNGVSSEVSLTLRVRRVVDLVEIGCFFIKEKDLEWICIANTGPTGT